MDAKQTYLYTKQTEFSGINTDSVREAAPEMLEALESVFLRLTFEHVTDWREERKIIGEIIGQAIKKANGQV